MSGKVCLSAKQALKMASTVMVSFNTLLQLVSPPFCITYITSYTNKRWFLTSYYQLQDSACLNLGATNEISSDTIHGTLCVYVKILVDAADASYRKSVRKDTVVSFLGALKGLASISHILLDSALEALSHTHPRAGMSEYAFNRDVKGMRDEFNQHMNDLEDGISNASSAEICKVCALQNVCIHVLK